MNVLTRLSLRFPPTCKVSWVSGGPETCSTGFSCLPLQTRGSAGPAAEMEGTRAQVAAAAGEAAGDADADAAAVSAGTGLSVQAGRAPEGSPLYSPGADGRGPAAVGWDCARKGDGGGGDGSDVVGAGPSAVGSHRSALLPSSQARLSSAAESESNSVGFARWWLVLSDRGRLS